MQQQEYIYYKFITDQYTGTFQPQVEPSSLLWHQREVWQGAYGAAGE